MLGRTHMAIGALGAAIATPLVLHAKWEPLSRLITTNWNTVPHVFMAQAGFVIASIIGSAIVDLDERHSLAAQRVERFAMIPFFLVMVWLVFLLHMTTSIGAWIVILIITFALHTQQNLLRKIGLGALGAGLLYAGVTNVIPLTGAFLLTAWLVGAMFTAHRTFTHSLPGIIVFGAGVELAIQGHALEWLGQHELGMLGVVAPIGFLVGYALHLAADIPSGGVPLLWPWGKRFGTHLMKSGGVWDHVIGVMALIGFVILVVVG